MPLPGRAAAVLQTEGRPLPTKMLALMTVLEKEGPEFADKLLVTVRGEHSVGEHSAAWESTAWGSVAWESAAWRRRALLHAHTQIT